MTHNIQENVSATYVLQNAARSHKKFQKNIRYYIIITLLGQYPAETEISTDTTVFLAFIDTNFIKRMGTL